MRYESANTGVPEARPSQVGGASMFVPVESPGLVARVLPRHAKKWEAIVKGCGARFCHLPDISRVKAENRMELEPEMQERSEWVGIRAQSAVGLRVLSILC